METQCVPGEKFKYTKANVTSFWYGMPLTSLLPIQILRSTQYQQYYWYFLREVLTSVAVWDHPQVWLCPLGCHWSISDRRYICRREGPVSLGCNYRRFQSPNHQEAKVWGAATFTKHNQCTRQAQGRKRVQQKMCKNKNKEREKWKGEREGKKSQQQCKSSKQANMNNSFTGTN